MRGIDTNILVRFLVGDDEHQAKSVYNLFKETESSKEQLFISTLVILELIWVLESVYRIKRDEILNSIYDLLLMPIFRFEHHSMLQSFIKNSERNACDLSDLLIGFAAKEQGCQSTITLDKKASKSELFEILK